MGAAVLIFGLCGSAHSQTGTLVAMSRTKAGMPLLKSMDVGNDAAPSPPLLTITRDVDEVRVDFVVMDRLGRTVTDLRPEELAVFDDRRPVARLESFHLLDDTPVRLGILIDVSSSGQNLLPTALSGARRFVRKSLRRTDEVFVTTFGQRSQMLQPPTDDVARLDLALATPVAPAYVTALYDAIVTNCRDIEPEGTGVRRSLVLLTDGQDNASMYSWVDAATESVRSGVAVFAVVLHPQERHPGEMLEVVADRSGGAVFYAANAQQVEDAFGKINELLHARYTVTFRAASRTSGFHQLQIVALRRDGLKVSARAGYFSPPTQP